jgi:hypothetical protein
MIREIEIEFPNQSDVVSFNILKNKKRDVQKLIDDLSSISSNYISIFISYRDSVFAEELQLKSQISFAIFFLFFCSSLLEMMSKHINIKTSVERVEVIDHVRSWKDITSSEIEAFIRILLYMSVSFMSRIIDYWNLNSKRAIHVLIIESMSCMRFQQIKRFWKISHFINDQKTDIRDSHWWKKLDLLIINFRKASKRYWTSDSHVSVDEQLVEFRERCAHAMMLTSKAVEVSFKLYSICQNNYLIDFLFISKIWSQNVEKQVWNADFLLR